ncbi:MAG: sensor histidine kinase [bacterium]|nr:sensor histidine kinase [bacterium]
MTEQVKQTEQKPKKRGTLRTKVAAWFLFVSVIPIIAMSYIVVLLVNLANERLVEELETQLVRQKSREVEKFFEETAGVLEVRVPLEIGDVTIVPENQRRLLMEETLRESKAIRSVSLYDVNGQELDRLDREVGFANDRDLIDGSQLEKIIAAQEGRSYFSPVRQTLEGAYISIAQPLKNSTDTTVGVLSGDIALTTLRRDISYGTLGSKGYILFFSDDGNIIAHSRSALDESAIRIGSIPYLAQFAQANAGAASSERVASFTQYASAWGERVVGYAEPLRNLPFVIAAEWPVDDAFRLSREIQTQALVFSLVVLVAVLLISFLVARRVTQPIRILREEAKRIGQGKFDDTIDIKTNDEIQELDEELHDMAEALKQLQQLREEFVFIAAHELRSPVTAIKGYISMILEEFTDTLPGDTRHMLEQVQRANQHLVQLVQDLLEVARSDAGRMKLEVSPQDLAAMAKTVISDLKPLWEEKKLVMTYQEYPGLPSALADADKLREVLVNLVSNATKYNRDAGTITVWHEVVDKTVVTHVADSGIGMAPEEVEKLFQKFYRAENTDTRKVQGTGLGLFIVKQIIEKMGGQIRVSSERGKGSTFSFALPIAPLEAKSN